MRTRAPRVPSVQVGRPIVSLRIAAGRQIVTRLFCGGDGRNSRPRGVSLLLGMCKGCQVLRRRRAGAVGRDALVALVTRYPERCSRSVQMRFATKVPALLSAHRNLASQASCRHRVCCAVNECNATWSTAEIRRRWLARERTCIAPRYRCAGRAASVRCVCGTRELLIAEEAQGAA